MAKVGVSFDDNKLNRNLRKFNGNLRGGVRAVSWGGGVNERPTPRAPLRAAPIKKGGAGTGSRFNR